MKRENKLSNLSSTSVCAAAVVVKIKRCFSFTKLLLWYIIVCILSFVCHRSPKYISEIHEIVNVVFGFIIFDLRCIHNITTFAYLANNCYK